MFGTDCSVGSYHHKTNKISNYCITPNARKLSQTNNHGTTNCGSNIPIDHEKLTFATYIFKTFFVSIILPVTFKMIFIIPKKEVLKKITQVIIFKTHYLKFLNDCIIG